MKVKIFCTRFHSPRQKANKDMPHQPDTVYKREKLCWEGEHKTLKAARKWVEDQVETDPKTGIRTQFVEVWAVVDASDHAKTEKARLEFFTAEEMLLPLDIECSPTP